MHTPPSLTSSLPPTILAQLHDTDLAHNKKIQKQNKNNSRANLSMHHYFLLALLFASLDVSTKLPA
jgi:hypothetical protein